MATTEAKTTTAKTTATKKPVTKKPVTKKPAAKKPTAAKTTATKKPVTKATTAKDTATGAVDFIKDTAKKVEALSQTQALSKAKTLISATENASFELGGVLAVIQDNGWWKDKGFENFRAFIEEGYNLHYRKAMYLVQIYKNLVNSGVPWEKVQPIGWTKLKEISHLLTEENVDDWVKRCTSMTVLQLKAYLDDLNKDPDMKSEAPEKLFPMNFKVHEDQKDNITQALEHAKESSGTEYDSVALDYVALAYNSSVLGKDVSSEELNPLTEIKKYAKQVDSLGDVLEAINEIYPDVDIHVVSKEDA